MYLSFSTKNIKKVPSIYDENIDKMNEKMKQDQLEKKDDKAYLTRISSQRIEKIGSKSLLDKQWAEKPLGVIKNPHKLTEVELYKALEKIVELPEKRLKNMLKQSDLQIDEVFMANIITRIPQFLTATLVNIVKTLLIQKDYFKDHKIWKVLENELHKRKNNLNNEQLATVIHGFGITGNGSQDFYSDMEEVIIDSPINIETPFLEKILIGYSQIDKGSPILYSDTVERIIQRGLNELEVPKIASIASVLNKATNVHKGGYGFYEAMEKHIHQEMFEGRITFQQLTQVAEHILPANIGSNKFQNELEEFIIKLYSTTNLQHCTDLIKGLSSYQVKNKALDDLIYLTVIKNINEFTVHQLETLIWSLSRTKQPMNGQNKKLNLKDCTELQQKALIELIEKVKVKSASMKPRGIAFALESIANLQYQNDEIYQWFEKVTFAKLNDFIPHYLVKILNCYYTIGTGSDQLYDKILHKVIDACKNEQMKYSDFIRFFEIYPEVTHIYDNSMTEELYSQFTMKIKEVISDKKFPTLDVCRVFNILVRISPYQPKKNNEKSLALLYEIIERMKHSVMDIPKDYFCLTLKNLIEFQQPDIAKKFIYIIDEVVKNKTLDEEFPKVKERIQLFWSLMQMQKSYMNPLIINQQNLSFINKVDLESLNGREFSIFKQLVCLVKMWQEDVEQDKIDKDLMIDFEQMQLKINNLSPEKREEFINEDPSSKTQEKTIQQISQEANKLGIFQEVSTQLVEQGMNLIEVACILKDSALQQNSKDKSEQSNLLALLVMNKHCFIKQSLNVDEQVPKRSVELKLEILEQLFGWNIIALNEQEIEKDGVEAQLKKHLSIQDSQNPNSSKSRQQKMMKQAREGEEESDDQDETERRGRRIKKPQAQQKPIVQEGN